MLGLLVALAISSSSSVADHASGCSEPAHLRVADAAEASRRIKGKKFTSVVKSTTEIFRRDGSYASLSDVPSIVGRYSFIGSRLCIELRHGLRSCRYILVSKDGRIFSRYSKGPTVEMISLGEAE